MLFGINKWYNPILMREGKDWVSLNVELHFVLSANGQGYRTLRCFALICCLADLIEENLDNSPKLLHVYSGIFGYCALC
jgi:hypothetical protein